ncbi:MAG: universal stress protein [Myxococcota bacterium]
MKPHQTLVLGLDFGEASLLGLRATTDLCQRLDVQRLYIVHGAGTPGFADTVTGSHAKLLAAAEDQMARLDLSELEGIEIHRVVRSGPPAQVVVEVAEQARADFIVLSSHRYGWIRRAVFGSVTSSILRTAEIPVLVLGPYRDLRFPLKRVTAAIDLSLSSQAVLASAVRFAQTHGAKTRVVTVAADPILDYDEASGPLRADENVRQALREALEGELAKLCEAHGGAVSEQAVLEGGAPTDTLLKDVTSYPASLLVLGTSGHNTWERFALGSTADRLAAEAPIPVLVIPVGAPPVE